MDLIGHSELDCSRLLSLGLFGAVLTENFFCSLVALREYRYSGDLANMGALVTVQVATHASKIWKLELEEFEEKLVLGFCHSFNCLRRHSPYE